MSDKDVKKAEKEAQEFARLKQIEKMRDLTDDEKKRLDEINKSEQFKKYTQATAEIAQKSGVDLPTMRSDEGRNAQQKTDRKNNLDQLETVQAQSSTLDLNTVRNSFISPSSVIVSQGISQTFNAVRNGQTNIIDLKQAANERSVSNLQASQSNQSNIDLILENKAELLDPKSPAKQISPKIQVASAATSVTTGLNF